MRGDYAEPPTPTRRHTLYILLSLHLRPLPHLYLHLNQANQVKPSVRPLYYSKGCDPLFHTNYYALFIIR